ncbi:MAG TPA: hypothetical protein VLC09_16885 [Polyangiaceae bacterium]|nr:hypothetical protein [Polyangiaceae bacterium]
MQNITLRDQGDTFQVSRIEVEAPSRLVLFAVGAGGNPERHEGLLNALAERGASVVAPHFERMLSPYPSEDLLVLRARRLRLALAAASRPGLATVGLGHSIGAASLLALAGGTMWLSPHGQPRTLPIEREPRLARVGLLAPAAGFFQAPGALDSVEVPLRLWSGELDTSSPPGAAYALQKLKCTAAEFDVRVLEGAGHYSFMNVLPPQVVDTLSDRERFLEELARDVGAFLFA